MKVVIALLWILSVAAAFALGLRTSDGGPPVLAPAASFREALAERDELSRAYRVSAFLQTLGPAELPAVLETLKTRNVRVTREDVRLLMLAWSRFDAPAAFAWARAWPGQWSDTLTEEAIYAWGFRDARAALREVEAVGDSEPRAGLMPPLLEGWIRSPDRAGASEQIATIDDPRRRRRLSLLLVAEIWREGPDALMRWAEAVPADAPNDFKRSAFSLAASTVAGEDPRRAVEWFEANRRHPYSAGSIEGIAQAWADRHDPPALFEWLRSLRLEGERGSEPADAVGLGFRAWIRRAPEEAEAWLGAALPDPALDPAIVELVRARSQSSPTSAVEWVARIQDETRRHQSAIQAGWNWWRQDPEAARAWLERSDLPEEVKQQIAPFGAAAIGAGPGQPR